MNFTPRTATEALRLAKTAEKALQILAVHSGYSIEMLFDESLPGVYFVQSPTGGSYTVNLNTETCSCPDFQRRGSYCKHLIAIEEHDASEKQCRDHDERAAAEAWF